MSTYPLRGRKVLVTGGNGFLGSALVRALLRSGSHVRSLDNDSRGSRDKLGAAADTVDVVSADIRDAAAVRAAVAGMDCVCHLAYVNGTEYFYTKPELVLEVAVKGMINVIDACLAHNVRTLVLASSSEVYQSASTIPTDETVPLVVPDVMNPRYSYGGGKIISELMALNYGLNRFDRVLIFRPHNVYGPDMGWEHVIPQFARRMTELKDDPRDPVPFPIQGTGNETRSFVYVDDFTDGLMTVLEKGEHRNIYNIGSTEEVRVADLARRIGKYFNREVVVVPGELAKGGTLRRCPDIRKLAALGYQPKMLLSEGLPPTVKWYIENAARAPKRSRPQEVSLT